MVSPVAWCEGALGPRLELIGSTGWSVQADGAAAGASERAEIVVPAVPSTAS